ncbi:GNAT family N-acetyltransferase [Euzebyella saccharophila]|uniref:GNAT family N-acetyltransferase n=1 Tax=Euzebyella saccharophila TaxID=679664 RepID=A0ABV8JNN9_9FLAO|nr:GNAT family N-acetyltransferase [Euzebyella saccharophila]
MEVQQEDNGKKGAFFMESEGERLASMTYTWAGPNKMIIDHTEVDDGLRGQGAGKKLLMQLVFFAREKNKKVLPLCPFANSVFQKQPDIQDVLS